MGTKYSRRKRDERYRPKGLTSDARPLEHQLWLKFVEFVCVSGLVHKELTTPKGFANHGYILWAAFVAGAEHV